MHLCMLRQRPSFHSQYQRPGGKGKKDKALSARDLNKPKNNVVAAYISDSKEGGDSI